MRLEVCETDFKILTGLFDLFGSGGRNAAITRKELIERSGVDYPTFTKQVKNNFLKKQILKERIK